MNKKESKIQEKERNQDLDHAIDQEKKTSFKIFYKFQPLNIHRKCDMMELKI